MKLIHGNMSHKLAQITSIHNSIATWRKDSKALNVITNYPRDISTPNISMICPTVTAECSMSFMASSSLQVTAKPLPATSKSAQDYGDFKILRVRLTDCLILVRIISRDLIGRLSSIWGCMLQRRTCLGRRRLLPCPPSPLRR
jgi:hypothetical protein